jgi:hypothetical protein
MDKNPYSDQSAARVDLGSLYPWAHEIGEHSIPDAGITRQRGMGFGGIFGIPDLRTIEFKVLAEQVAQAYHATKTKQPSALSSDMWIAQFKYLDSWVQRGIQGIYDFNPKQVHERHFRIIPKPGNPGRSILREGHHRGLALWILGERTIWALVGIHPSQAS